MKKFPILLLLILFLCIPAVGQIKPMLGTQLDWGNPTIKGLVGYWPFNEGTGNTAFDLSGNNSTGTLIANTHFVPGKFGFALDFDGIGDYVNVGKGSNLDITGDMSFFVWLKTTKADDGSIFYNYKDESPYPGFMIIIGRHVPTKFQYFDSGCGWETGNTSANDGKWHFLGVSINSGNGTFYFDGNPDGTFSDSLLVSSPGTDKQIGKNEFALYYEGQIDHIMLYNRGLSQSEATLLYQKSPSAFVKRDYTSLWGSTLGNGISIIHLLTAIKNQ